MHPNRNILSPGLPEAFKIKGKCEKGSTALEVREEVENEGTKRGAAAAPFLKANAHPLLEWGKRRA